ncbi:MAG: FeoB-associated Cys-rich membrane protein [Candidatus Limivicinus sp.]|jgi:hypothetical protein
MSGIWGNIIVFAILAVVIFFAVRSIIKKHKSRSCCGDCASCCGGCTSVSSEKKK